MGPVAAPIPTSNQADQCPDLNKDTKQALREGYSYSAKYTSGELFRHMRLCHYDNDPLGVQRWRGRFSSSQDTFLEQLFKRPILVEALDSILHIQADFFGLRLYVLRIIIILFINFFVSIGIHQNPTTSGNFVSNDPLSP